VETLKDMQRAIGKVRGALSDEIIHFFKSNYAIATMEIAILLDEERN
jgi:hypothetical protein